MHAPSPIVRGYLVKKSMICQCLFYEAKMYPGSLENKDWSLIEAFFNRKDPRGAKKRDRQKAPHLCWHIRKSSLFMVHAANIHDTKGAPNLFQRTYEKYPTIQAFCGDAGYCGTSVNFVKDILGPRLDISKKIKDQFVILPKTLDC